MLLQCCRSAARSSKPLVLGPRISHLGPKKIVFGSYPHGVNMSSKNAEEAVIYTGPLATVAKRLKLFSISSLGLSGAISPFVFILDFPVPVFAKSILVGSALFTSISSTALINWVMSPYVTEATVSSANSNLINLHTLNVLAQEHVTTVHVDALQPSTRVFTNLMINEGKIGEAQGRIGEKSVKPKQLFYVHPETCESGPLNIALYGAKKSASGDQPQS